MTDSVTLLATFVFLCVVLCSPVAVVAARFHPSLAAVLTASATCEAGSEIWEWMTVDGKDGKEREKERNNKRNKQTDIQTIEAPQKDSDLNLSSLKVAASGPPRVKAGQALSWRAGLWQWGFEGTRGGGRI